MGPGTPSRLRIVAVLVWLGGIAVGLSVGEAAQLQLRGPAAEAIAPDAPGDAADAPDAPSRGIFATPDRSLLRLFGKAEQLVDEDRYAEAVRCLGAILDSPEDYFFQPDHSGPVHRSLKSEAQRMLGQMPRRGRELYELHCGAQARQMLDDAATGGDPYRLAEVSRRFFHTQAGYEATLLLGIYHLSEGRSLAAALTLQRLREACPDADRFEPTLSTVLAACWIRCEMPEKAWHVLAELRERFPNAQVTIAGRQIPLFSSKSGELDLTVTEEKAIALLADDDNPLGRLARMVGLPSVSNLVQSRQWAMLRGNAARTASVSGSAPLMSLQWRVPTTEHPYVEALIDGIRQDDEDHGQAALPVLQPLAVDDVLLMRTARNLLAVDFKTGKRIWQTPADDPFDQFVNPSPDMPVTPAVQIAHALRMRMWGDATYGTLSSDGQLVFAVEDLELETGMASVRGLLMNARRSTGDSSQSNRLAAYDVHTGKLQWHIGGSEEEYGLPEAGAFFLGPPLPLMKQLFVLAETKGEIRLLALEAKSGKLIWSQQLADADRGVVLDPLRRFSGLSPSYADGIIVCPTSNRAIVAVELATRSLLWGYTYAAGEDEPERSPAFLGSRTVAMLDPSGRWSDSSLALADGCVVATPLDSGDVHCLSLIDGSPRWARPREGDLYRACVYDGKVVMVGRRQVRAWKLDNGEPAWDGRTVTLPDEGMPSGTGFLSGNLYFVPLSSAEVVAIDLDKGRQASVSRSRTGSVPGNLVCYEDKVISQRAGAVEVYYQLDSLAAEVSRRLAQKPDDPQALALQGEILWHEGKLDEAIAACRRSVELAPPELRKKSRDLLREALFEGLQTDFAAHRNDADQIEKLIDTPAQRATFLRLMATGFEKTGEYGSALDSYLKLIDVDLPLKDDRPMEAVDHSLSVRLDRWIQIQLGRLRTEAPAEVLAALDAAAQSRLEAALAEGTPESLRLYLDYFGRQPTADRAERQLVASLRKSGRLLEAELLLRRRERSGDRDVAAQSLAELADLLDEAGRADDAAACYARLAGEFADVVCRDGKTGKQLCDALADDDPVRAALEPVAPWPQGKVEVATSVPSNQRPPTYLTWSIDYRGSIAPFLPDYGIELTPNPAMLVGRDGWGDPKWQLSLSDLARQQGFFLNRNLLRAAADGHLLMLRTGDQVTAVDLLGETPEKGPRILWTREIEESAGGDAVSPGPDKLLRQAAARLPGGGQAWFVSRGFGVSVPSPVLAGEELAAMVRLRSCIGLDPVTGRTLWIRQNLPPDSQVFGDRDYVFVVPPDGTDATVLSAADGRLLGTRSLPPEADRLASFGRLLVVWRLEDDHRVLELTDPWKQAAVWPSMTFAPDAQIDLVEQDEKLAVQEPGGRFALVDLTDGRLVIDAKLDAEPHLAGVRVLPSPDGYVLVSQAAQDAAQRDPNRQFHPLPATKSLQMGRGRVMAFGRDGKPLWDSPRSIKDQYLLLDQPRRLPVLLFACVVRERKDNRQYQMGVAIQAIDKRTGRKVIDTRVDKSTNSFLILGDPIKKTVEIQMQQSTVAMTFTDEPWPPQTKGPAEDEAASAPQTPAAPVEAIWKAILKAATTPPQPGTAKEGAAKEGAAKEGAAKEGAAKEGAAKEGAAKEGAAKEGAANPRPQRGAADDPFAPAEAPRN